MTTLVPAPTRPLFRMRRNDHCLCGSGKRFRQCCGDVSPGRDVPAGINIINDYLDAAACRKLLKLAEAQPGSESPIFDREKSSAEEIVHHVQSTRVSQRVDMQPHQAVLNALVADIVEEHIQTVFDDKADWLEEPQLLRYEPGSFYIQHSDSENLLETENCWIKDHDRDASLLVYLDGDFEGGELYFPNFDFTLRPEPGMLVTFPSDSRYLHEARKVTAGVRHAIVSWVALAGQPKLRKPPHKAVFCQQ